MILKGTLQFDSRQSVADAMRNAGIPTCRPFLMAIINASCRATSPGELEITIETYEPADPPQPDPSF